MQLVSDNFNRANAGNLGANWLGAFVFSCQIVSNAVQSQFASSNCGNIFTLIAWPNNQYSEFQLLALASTSSVGAVVRYQFGLTASCYEFALLAGGGIGVPTTAAIRKFNNSATVSTTLASTTITPLANDFFHFEAQDNALTGFRNGTAIPALTGILDSTFSGGITGIRVFESTSTFSNCQIDNWAGGDLLVPGAESAIVFDNSATLGSNGGTTNSLTSAFTVGLGANRYLLVGINGAPVGGADDITGVTYAGVPMTLIAENALGNANNKLSYVYGLANPTSGANNVVISCTANHNLSAGAWSCSGAAQTGQPDNFSIAAENTNAQAAPTVNTSSPNDWVVLFTSEANASTPIARANCQLRSVDASGTWGLLDSANGVQPNSTQMFVQVALNSAFVKTTMVAIKQFPPTGGIPGAPGWVNRQRGFTNKR